MINDVESEQGKTILITGAGGLLGRELIKQLSSIDKYRIIALTSKKDQLLVDFHQIKDLEVFSIKDWKTGNLPWEEIDILIHCAFARTSNGQELIDSLNFTNNLFVEAIERGISGIINISSQSVYGQINQPLWTEDMAVSPDSIYALAKYSSELLTNNVSKISKNNIYTTNIRLASLIGMGFDVRLTSKFIQHILNDEPIKIVGGKQTLSYMDIRDAASGLIALLKIKPVNWRKLYNLGSNKCYSIIEIANIVKEVAKEYTNNPVNIEIEEKDIVFDTGIDSSCFYKDINWQPEYDIRDTIDLLFQYLTRE